MQKITKQSTIAEAKRFLRENFDDGCDCPACGQLVKKYKYNINASIGVTLIEMWKLHQKGSEWVHVNSEIRPLSGGYFSLAQQWNLIEGKQTSEEGVTKRVSGYWRLTPRGNNFVNDRITVPKYVEIYDGKVVGWSDEQIGIEDCLGKKFHYAELMKS